MTCDVMGAIVFQTLLPPRTPHARSVSRRVSAGERDALPTDRELPGVTTSILAGKPDCQKSRSRASGAGLG